MKTVSMETVNGWIAGHNVPAFRPDCESAVEVYTDNGEDAQPTRISFVVDGIVAPNVVPFHFPNSGKVRVCWHFGSGYEKVIESRDYQITG